MRPNLPQTKDSGTENFIQVPPAAPALDQLRSDVGSTVVTVDVDPDTTWIRIHSPGSQGVYVKFAEGVTTSDFDDFIIPGTTLDLADVSDRGIAKISLVTVSSSSSIVIVQR